MVAPLVASGVATTTAKNVATGFISKMLPGVGIGLLASQLVLTAMKYLTNTPAKPANVTVGNPNLYWVRSPWLGEQVPSFDGDEDIDPDFPKEDLNDRYKRTAEAWQSASEMNPASSEMISQVRDRVLEVLKRELPDDSGFNQQIFKTQPEWSDFENKLTETLTNSVRNKANGGKKNINEVNNTKLDSISSKLNKLDKLDKLDGLLNIASNIMSLVNKECCDLSPYFVYDNKNIAQITQEKVVDVDLTSVLTFDNKNIAQIIQEKECDSGNFAVLEGAEIIN